jgi:hypothetical protein
MNPQTIQEALMRYIFSALTVLALLAADLHAATPTENMGIRVLPAPGPVVIDGSSGDWDLSGGIFACNDVESQRTTSAVWIHMMYDAQNLYMLAHFIDDTPLNNPGQTIGDYGFSGDSIQLRFQMDPAAQQSRISHWTCWRGRDNKDLMDVAYGQNLNEGAIKDAKQQGAQQAFAKDADGRGYTQELAIPWKLLTRDGAPVRPGEKFVVTSESNFTVGANGRLSVKDIFKPGVKVDRVFTFQGPGCWGFASCETKGAVTPQPVRLADGREFPVRTVKHGLSVDWSALTESSGRQSNGFKPIKFTLPEDGIVSLNIAKPDGTVVRQLLTAEPLKKGEHTIEWDGLTTPSWTRVGQPVEAGEYQWSALYHGEIGLRFRGWACNGGEAPWDGPTGRENWGGDHGVPAACAADERGVYLGWTSAEAGKALLACDADGRVRWRNNRQGISGASLLATDGGNVYAVNAGPDGSDYVYRLSAEDGAYVAWPGTESPDLVPQKAFASSNRKFTRIGGLDARDGKLCLAFPEQNTLALIDISSGKLEKLIDVPAPTQCTIFGAEQILVISAHKDVLALDPKSRASKPFIAGLSESYALASDHAGRVYVGVRDPDNQVKVYDSNGKAVATIGRAGGRARIGPWTPQGMLYISGIAVDAAGKLWVAEADSAPKRVSVWNTRDGSFVTEFFGPTSYGALGGAIDPLDPNRMSGQGCEWKVDPKTGKAVCLGTITREGMENARYALGSNGKVYLAVAGNWAHNIGPLRIFERTGDGQFALRTSIFYADANGSELPLSGHGQPSHCKQTFVWADKNGDGQRQPDELSGAAGELRFSGWYMNFGPDMTLYSGNSEFKMLGFTACGAPRYDLANPTKMPAPGLGSADGRLVLQPGEYGVDHGLLSCFDIASGKMIWSYPDNFNGVHGSHNAPAPERGLIRGSYGPCGSIKLPEPIGNIWLIPTNVGEWHVLTERGFYLTRLFQSDPMKVVWPVKAISGADMGNAPPGLGGEDFGGSATLAADGHLYVQAGKTGYWNLEVTGLDSVKSLAGGTFNFTPDDVQQAVAFRQKYLNPEAGAKRLAVRQKTPTLTGNLETDFAGADIVSFKKSPETAVRAAMAWDAQNLYAAWDVTDATPWKNGADAPEELYLRGDTVDLQLGTDAHAASGRSEAVLGDLRLSIGSYKGIATAVLYRKVARDKHPRSFSSGIVKEYVMESVTTLKSATIKVTLRESGYVVEAAIPLSELEFKPETGASYRGDLGATHGDPAGQRTRLRSYWSNAHTGIVDDAVYELQLEPQHWGEMTFEGAK